MLSGGLRRSPEVAQKTPKGLPSFFQPGEWNLTVSQGDPTTSILKPITTDTIILFRGFPRLVFGTLFTF